MRRHEQVPRHGAAVVVRNQLATKALILEARRIVVSFGGAKLRACLGVSLAHTVHGYMDASISDENMMENSCNFTPMNIGGAKIKINMLVQL